MTWRGREHAGLEVPAGQRSERQLSEIRLRYFSETNPIRWFVLDLLFFGLLAVLSTWSMLRALEALLQAGARGGLVWSVTKMSQKKVLTPPRSEAIWRPGEIAVQK